MLKPAARGRRLGPRPAPPGKKEKNSLPGRCVLVNCRESSYLWSLQSPWGLPTRGDHSRPGKGRPMGTIRDILAYKGSHVLSIGKGASVLDASLVMNEHKVGAVVVADEGRLVGMFTERDVLRRVVGERRDPVTTPV